MKKILVLLLCYTSIAAAWVQGATDSDDPPDPVSRQPNYSSVEERRILVALQEERQSLSREREEIAEKKKELKRLAAEVDKKLDQLKTTRQQIERLLAEKDARERKRIEDLSKMYQKMAPDKAARIFQTIDRELAIAILEKMKAKSAARILGNMDQEHAAGLTTAFSTLDRD